VGRDTFVNSPGWPCVASEDVYRKKDGRVELRGALPEPEWREALRAICEDARADDVQSERLLVELKQAVGILCDTCLVPHGPARMEFMSRVVTLCIEEYYAERGGQHVGVRPSGGDR